jgi:ornithine--oxo-acid transaminase
MAPGAIQIESPTTNNAGTGLKATARAFHPTGTPDPSKYHSSSTAEAIGAEGDFAAHNYHPLPIGRYPVL